MQKSSHYTDDILNPAISKHNGKLIKSLGDGWLVSFGSCHDAVSCSNSLKQSIASNPLDIRFGINSGDVQLENNDVFGDTVNIAARLEAISSSNEITSLQSVYQSLEKDMKNDFKDQGPVMLKIFNILFMSGPLQISIKHQVQCQAPMTIQNQNLC